MVPEVGISRRFCWFLDREGSMHVQNAVFSWREKKKTRRRGQTAVEASNNEEQTAVGEHQVQIPSHPPVIFTNGWAKGGGV